MRAAHSLFGISALAATFSGGGQAQTVGSLPTTQAPSVEASPPVDQSRPAERQPAAINQLEDIVVTASRRDETIQKTPTAVSAFGGGRLQQAQITSLVDLVTTTPNVQIGTTNTSSNITIRGIGNTQLTAGSDPGVALHVDGVYLAQSALAVSTFLDVNRVEILRGPQGTLFGRNATGGAINIIPNLPTDELKYGFDVSVGADPTLVRSSAYASGPLNDDGTLRGRLAVQQNYNRGFTRNLASTGPRYLDDQNNVSTRGQLEWLPTPDFTARLSFEYQREDSNGPAFYLLGTPDPNQPLPVQIQGAPRGDPSDFSGYENYGVRQLDAKTVLLTTDWRIGGGNLKALYSYNETDQFTDVEGDGTPVDFTSTAFRQHAHQHYAELLYASDGDRPFSYVVGANFFDEHLYQDIEVAISYLPVPVTLRGTIDTTSYAGFAHAQYRITPRLRVFAGLRYSHDHKSIDDFNNFIGSLSQAKSWSRVTYEAGVSYDVSRSVTGYAKYATGYKSGGFSAGALQPAFNPETDTNLEVGLKGTYLGGRLQANIAGFHMKYSDLQVNQVVGVSSAVTNAARATIDGFEGELVARPVERVRLELAGSYLDARFDQFLTQDSSRPALGLLNLAGNMLPSAPKVTASAGAYYDLPLTSGKLSFGARYDWKSRLYFSEFNLGITSQAPIGKADLTVLYTTDSQRWSAGVFARNVTNEAIKSQAYAVSAILGSLVEAELQPGRQVGITAGYHF